MKENFSSSIGGNAGPVLLGDRLVAHHHAEDAGGARRVAVRVLARAGGDVQGLREVPLAVEEAEGDVGPVEAGVDVEGAQGAVGAQVVAVPLLLEAGSTWSSSPSGARCARPGRRRSTWAYPLSAGMDFRPSSTIVRGSRLEEGSGVHPAHEHPAVETVAVVHHPAHPVGVLVRLLGQTRGHEADEVRLDLEVDVVGVDVVLRVTGHRGLDAPVQVAPSAGVGVPQLVLRVAEHVAVLLGGGLEADGVHHLGERHLHVEVVLVDRVLDHLRRPRQLAFDDLPVGLELGRRPEGHPDHLARPAASDLVLESRPAEAPLRSLLLGATGQGTTQRQTQYCGESHHLLRAHHTPPGARPFAGWRAYPTSMPAGRE